MCDRSGKRLYPKWKQHGRVQVDLSWLQRWYRSLDELLELKNDIEKELFSRLLDLFSLETELVFYDLTSTYFEGHGPCGLARHGYSRDGKPRKRQVLLGVVMINGWPIAHHVFRGNKRDERTMCEKSMQRTREALEKLSNRVQAGRTFYHRKEDRVCAHVFVAALSFLLDRALEKKLKAARVPLSSAQALKSLKTIHVPRELPSKKKGGPTRPPSPYILLEIASLYNLHR